MRKLTVLFAALLSMAVSLTVEARQTEVRYLSGHGADDMVEWDFYYTAGRNSGQWTTIGVPSCWEMQGFGTLQYGYLFDPWYGGCWKDTQRQGNRRQGQVDEGHETDDVPFPGKERSHLVQTTEGRRDRQGAEGMS